MVVDAFDNSVISVSDMDESLAFYRDFVGMRVVADYELEGEEIEQLWNPPKGVKAGVVVLKIVDGTTMSRFGEFQPRS